jgi:hypothetical protein
VLKTALASAHLSQVWRAAAATSDGRWAALRRRSLFSFRSPHLVPIGALAALDAAPSFLELEVDLWGFVVKRGELGRVEKGAGFSTRP